MVGLLPLGLRGRTGKRKVGSPSYGHSGTRQLTQAATSNEVRRQKIRIRVLEMSTRQEFGLRNRQEMYSPGKSGAGHLAGSTQSS